MPGLPRSTIQLLDKLLRGRLADVHVALPGQVQTYAESTNLADVKVMVEQPIFDDDGDITSYENIGVLPGVPVAWPRFGGYYLIGPLNQGDEGMLVFCSTPIGEWRNSGQLSKPADTSRHSIGWPMFFPMGFNDTRTLPDAGAAANGIVLGKEGGAEQLLIETGLIQAGASGAASLAKNQAIADLQSAINAYAPTGTGDGAALKVALATWLTNTYGTTLFKAK